MVVGCGAGARQGQLAAVGIKTGADGALRARIAVAAPHAHEVAALLVAGAEPHNGLALGAGVNVGGGQVAVERAPGTAGDVGAVAAGLQGEHGRVVHALQQQAVVDGGLQGTAAAGLAAVVHRQRKVAGFAAHGQGF